jgi:hypothetical protein
MKLFEGVIEKNKDKKYGHPSLARIDPSEEYPVIRFMATLKYRKLSEFIGISIFKNKILMDNPIIPIIKSDKNMLFEKNEILFSNFSIIDNLFFSNILPTNDHFRPWFN